MGRSPIPLNRASRLPARERVAEIIVEHMTNGSEPLVIADAVLAALRRSDIPRGNHGGPHSSKLTVEDVQDIRDRATRETTTEIAADYPQVDPATVGDIIRRKTWRNVPECPEWLQILAEAWSVGLLPKCNSDDNG